jgi:ABC-type maltose transport system permease subunit
MAGSVTALIPVFLLFMAAQRFFIEGITLSGTRS